MYNGKMRAANESYALKMNIIVILHAVQNYFYLIGCKECNLSVIALLKPVQNPVITPDWSFNRVQIVVIMLHWLTQ